MTPETAEQMVRELKALFPGIDARVSIDKVPNYQTQKFEEHANVPVYYNHLNILVITSEAQFAGFIAIAYSINPNAYHAKKGGE